MKWMTLLSKAANFYRINGFRLTVRQTYFFIKFRLIRFLSRSSAKTTENGIFLTDRELLKFEFDSSLRLARREKNAKIPSFTSKRIHTCTVECSNDPTLSVIVPTIGRFQRMTLSMVSLENTLTKSGVSYSVHVVPDANSNSDEELFIKSVMEKFDCPRMNLSANSSKKSGFAELINSEASSLTSKYLLILNDDIILDIDCVERLLQNTSPLKNEIVTPLVLNPDRTIQEGGCLIQSDGSVTMVGRSRHEESFGDLQRIEIPFHSASCWLLDRNFFLECGGFHTFINKPYYEDLDFVVRNRATCILVPTAKIVHFLSSSQKNTGNKTISKEVIKNIFLENYRTELKDLSEKNKVKLFAFYLPQFHPNAVNNDAWGRGYTEWSAVASAKDFGPVHFQPHVPTELGYYDLRLKETIEQQSRLAKHYGIDAFAIMTYWFNGETVLDEPLKVFESSDLDNDFFLYWANETWSRKWDGGSKEVILNQTHSLEDSAAFIIHHKKYFLHPRYMRIHSKPVLFIYRKELFENPEMHISQLRRTAREVGVGEIFIGLLESFDNSMKREDPTVMGFDCAVEYPPHGNFPEAHRPNGMKLDFKGRLHKYEDLVMHYESRQIEEYPLIKTVTPGFDNTARLGRDSTIFLGSDYSMYTQWLRNCIEITKIAGKEVDFWVGINAWNEWSESAFLEPSKEHGRNLLYATHLALTLNQNGNRGVRHE
jgi:hypothetical protein